MTKRLLVLLPFIALFICETGMMPWREVIHRYLLIIAIVWGGCLLYATCIRFTLTLYYSKKTFNHYFTKGVIKDGKKRQEE